MKKIIPKIASILLSITIASLFIFASKKEKNSINTSSNKIDTIINTSKYYKVKALKIPTNLYFAKERVPLNKTDIKERIDRELLVNTYWQSNGLLMFKRAHKYFPIIEPILKKYGVPDDFKYLALVESGLQNITSPAGARGIWQIMKTTAKENRLEVNTNVDERYHLEKATKVACKYLKDAKQRFGTWALAAAAYNAGNAGIAKRIKAQEVNSYYDLLLPGETERYIPRMIAVKEILTHPKKYGFYFNKEDLYTLKPTYKVKVDTAITNIAKFAKKFGTNYKTLKIYNPWLRENKLNNKSRKVYYIKIPK